MKTFRRVLGYAKPLGKYWPAYLIISLLSVLFGVLNYGLIDPLLTIIFDPGSIASQHTMPHFTQSQDYFKELFSYFLTKTVGESSQMRSLLLVCLAFVAASFFSNLLKYLSQRILVSLRTRLMYNLRKELFNKITRLHLGYFHDKRKGDILSSISNDVTEMQNSIAGAFHILFRDPILIAGFLIMLFYMSPQLTAVTLLVIPITAFVIGRLIRTLKQSAAITQSLMGRIVSHFEEAITGSRIIKAFNAQKYINSHFDITNNRHRSVSKKVFNRQELATPLSEFLGISLAVAVLMYGGYLHMKGTLGIDWAGFVVYIGFYWKVLESAKSLSNAFAILQKGIISADRVFAIMDAEINIVKSKDPIAVHSFNEEIEYKGVGFRYNYDYVLKDISFKIKKGEMIALVGPSGAGKSTLADLLPRFYDVTDGSILLDGINIRDYEPKGLISLMGIVSQEAILFNDTVFNNIAFGLSGVSEEDVINAARIANADEFIVQMKDGYQTNIGDRGQTLSGGQRQRLAIARAVLKNPPILILDEATSSLDTESERLVQDALLKLMENRTTIVIAHRLSTIKNADEIIVLKDGRIHERGNHNQLMENGGLYSHLCSLQAFN
ncbi:MAG: ABC transporter ATP-binding protein [Bacteroidales bacterium]|nr:ABC transporter ATP-binding protein/permease [Bacteroidales bacterium]MDD2424600.1 ABC transporter ATP-binding protein [Bacteroidales bacterium]MDD3988726.1 ABC transporter ATP-binding protein [Bacteroidales bacterium]